MKKRQKKKCMKTDFYRKSATMHHHFIAIFHMANVVFPNNTFKADNPDKL